MLAPSRGVSNASRRSLDTQQIRQRIHVYDELDECPLLFLPQRRGSKKQFLLQNYWPSENFLCGTNTSRCLRLHGFVSLKVREGWYSLVRFVELAQYKVLNGLVLYFGCYCDQQRRDEDFSRHRRVVVHHSAGYSEVRKGWWFSVITGVCLSIRAHYKLRHWKDSKVPPGITGLCAIFNSFLYKYEEVYLKSCTFEVFNSD